MEHERNVWESISSLDQMCTNFQTYFVNYLIWQTQVVSNEKFQNTTKAHDNAEWLEF